MNINIGQSVTYYPPPIDKADNRHFPAIVEAIGKRVKIRAFMLGEEAGEVVYVSQKRLVTGQMDLVNDHSS